MITLLRLVNLAWFGILTLSLGVTWMLCTLYTDCLGGPAVGLVLLVCGTMAVYWSLLHPGRVVSRLWELLLPFAIGSGGLASLHGFGRSRPIELALGLLLLGVGLLGGDAR